MVVYSLDLLSDLTLGSPFVAIVAILAYYSVKRAVYNHKRRQGKSVGFCPSASTLELILLFAQVFYRPSVTCMLEAQQEEHVEQDDQEDRDQAARSLNRQLRQIRRGEAIERLSVQLEKRSLPGLST